MFLIQDDDFKITNNGKGLRVRRMTWGEASDLKKSVKAALSNNSPTSEKYIKDLIERVAFNTKSEIISTDILDLFGKVYESRGDDPTFGGMWIFMETSLGSFGVNQWDWVGGRGSAEIHMHFTNGVPVGIDKLSLEEQNNLRNQRIQYYICSPQLGGMPTIHELMHVAVKGSVRIGKGAYAAGLDSHYADAVADLAGEPRPVYIPESAVIYPTLKLAGTSLAPHIILYRNKEQKASAYWGQRLDQACKYPSPINGYFTNFKLYKDENK